MKTSPKIIAKRIAPEAAGLRAMPSQAAAATRDWAIPQAAAAMAIENPAEMVIHMATCSGGFPAAPSCAKAGAATSAVVNNNISKLDSFFTFFSIL
jgi:hypothetical protein